MDLNTLRSLSTIFVMLAFIGVCWWAFAPSRRKRFEEDANLPFADEDDKSKSNDSDVTNKSLHPESDEERQD